MLNVCAAPTWRDAGTSVLCSLSNVRHDSNPHTVLSAAGCASLTSWFLFTAPSECQYFCDSQEKSNLGLASYFHTFWSGKIKIDAKNIPGSSVFSEHVCFVICYCHHFFMTTPAWKAVKKKKMNKKNFQMEIWHGSLKKSHSPRFNAAIPCESWNDNRGSCRNKEIQ